MEFDLICTKHMLSLSYEVEGGKQVGHSIPRNFFFFFTSKQKLHINWSPEHGHHMSSIIL